MRVGGDVADMPENKFSESVSKPAAGAQNQGGFPVRHDAAVREIATETEVREQLFALDDDALRALHLSVAKYRWLLGLPQEDVEELVNETFQRVLSGDRKWAKDVAFMAFLLQAMRSIAWEVFTRNQREVPESRIVTQASEDEEESYLEQHPAENGGPEDAARFARFANAVEGFFKDDDEVMAVIIGRVEGLSEAETREQFGMTQAAFRAAQKRLLRARAGKLGDWR